MPQRAQQKSLQDNICPGLNQSRALFYLVDFLKKYDHEEIRFSDAYNNAIEICKKIASELLNNEKFIKLLKENHVILGFQDY